MPEFLKIPEVAALLRVHPMTVRRWIKSGTLPAIKVGRDYRVSMDDVRALTQTHEDESEDES